MPKYGENIYHRKDGRWEARYIAMRLPNGKAKYKSVYGRTHDIAKKKQLAAMQALTHESTAACELTLKELFLSICFKPMSNSPHGSVTVSCWNAIFCRTSEAFQCPD